MKIDLKNIKIDWKSVLPRAIVGVAVVALVAVMLSMASRTGELDAAETEQKTPISFTAQVGEKDVLEKVAENDTYTLYANLKDPTIKLVRKSDGAAVSSRPEGMEEMEDLKNAVRLSMGSMLNIRYADRDSNITEVNSATGSVARGNFAAKAIANGVRFDFHFANEGFLVPLEITLTDKGSGHPDALKLSIAHLVKRSAGNRITHQHRTGALAGSTHIIGDNSSVAVVVNLATLRKLTEISLHRRPGNSRGSLNFSCGRRATNVVEILINVVQNCRVV